MTSNDPDKLESIIDRALWSYSGVEPLAGIEQRVLNRIRAAPAAPRRPALWRWALAVPALGALVFTAIGVRKHHQPAPRVGRAVQAGTASSRTASAGVPPLVELPERGQRRRSRVKRSPSPQSLPKEERFPARAPITGEERALLALIARNPAQTRQAFAELQERNGQMIEIPPIQIPPLQIDGAQ